jgi:hypothetical protein
MNKDLPKLKDSEIELVESFVKKYDELMELQYKRLQLEVGEAEFNLTTTNFKRIIDEIGNITKLFTEDMSTYYNIKYGEVKQ